MSRWTTQVVRVCERREKLLHYAHHLRQRHARAAFQAARQLLALHQIHGDVGRALVLAVVEDRDDVGMREASGRMRLTLEARAHVVELLGSEAVGAQHLEGHGPLDHGIERLIHDAHCPAPDLVAQLVLPYPPEPSHDERLPFPSTRVSSLR
jgi:hypothetical protein